MDKEMANKINKRRKRCRHKPNQFGSSAISRTHVSLMRTIPLACLKNQCLWSPIYIATTLRQNTNSRPRSANINIKMYGPVFSLLVCAYILLPHLLIYVFPLLFFIGLALFYKIIIIIKRNVHTLLRSLLHCRPCHTHNEHERIDFVPVRTESYGYIFKYIQTRKMAFEAV